MSQTIERPPVNFATTTGHFGGGVTETEHTAALIPMVPAGGTALDRAQANIVTASRVAVKRNVPDIVRRCREIATAKGDAIYYHWQTNNRDGSRGIVEGPTIVAAMIAAQTYGNCAVRALPVSDTPTHWTFAAEFVDAEAGFTVVRTFQQRKAQNTGMKDPDRQADMIFQIGQSKAMRNAVVAALSWLTDEMIDAAKDGLLQRINKAPDKARAWLLQQIEQLEIPVANVERTITRKWDQWTVPDMARLMSQLSSIKDGFANAADLFPDSPREDQPETSKPAKADADAAAPKRQRAAPKPAPTEREAPAEPRQADDQGEGSATSDDDSVSGLEFT